MRAEGVEPTGEVNINSVPTQSAITPQPIAGQGTPVFWFGGVSGGISGEREAGDSKQEAVSSEPKTVSSEQLAVSSRGGNPTVRKGAETVGSEQKTGGSKQKAVGSKESRQ